jgi:hypothetical protein
MGKENSEAQNNEKSNNSFKHRRILRNRFTKRSTFCTVKEIPVSEMNFSRHDDFEQHCARVQNARPRLMIVPAFPLVTALGAAQNGRLVELGLKAKGK